MKNLVFFFIVLSSCTMSNNNQIPKYNIVNGFGKGEKLLLSTFYDTISYCQPDYIDGFFVSARSKIVSTSENLIILDPTLNKIACFNASGKFLNYIGNIGSGPGEYNSIMDICIDNTESILFVFDYVGKQILHYSIDGKLINISPCKIQFTKFLFHENYFITLNPRPTQCFSNNFAIAKISFNGDIIKQFHKRPIESPISKPALFSSLYILNDTICFWDSYSDTVFFIKDNTVLPKFVFNIGKNKIPSALYDSNTLFYQEYKNYDNITGFLETEKYVFVWGHSQVQPKLIVFSKNDKSSKNVFIPGESRGLINDLDEGPNFFPNYFNSNKKLVQVLSIDQLNVQSFNKIPVYEFGNPLVVTININ